MGYTPITPSSGTIHACIKHPIVGVVILLLVVAVPSYFNAEPVSNCTQPMITFTFDEAYHSAYSEAYPILTKYGYTGTVYVPTDFVGQPGHLTLTELWALQNNAWEIGSQGKTYSDLTTLDETELSEEILGSRASLESNFLHIWGFASPYGKYNEEVLNLTSTQYLYHRTINPGLNNIPLAEDQVYELKAVNVTSETTVEEVKDWMIQAKNEKKWLILVFHDIDGQDENSWPAENLEEIAKFARDNDFQGIWTERPVITTFNMIT
ncbi:MAG: hypothetical protein MCSN_0090 [Candidatus Microsyncoccus archaeolyticus]|nr:MAG: hypothetical protein MCSN_0090 [Candidatus Parcubacteria bacterium]